MKYGIKDGMELFIYDEEGNYVAHVDYSEETLISNNLMLVDSSLIGEDLIGFANTTEKRNKSDFESFFDSKQTTYIVNLNSNKKVKIIGKSTFRGVEDMMDRNVYYEIPNATLVNKPEFKHSYTEVAKFNIIFEIEPFNKQGDLYKLRIEE
jgi:hypothetical protein